MTRKVSKLDYENMDELRNFIADHMTAKSAQKHEPIKLKVRGATEPVNFWLGETEGPHIFGRSGKTVASSREALIRLESLELIVF